MDQLIEAICIEATFQEESYSNAASLADREAWYHHYWDYDLHCKECGVMLPWYGDACRCEACLFDFAPFVKGLAADFDKLDR